MTDDREVHDLLRDIDNDLDVRQGWRRCLSAGLYDAGHLLPPASIRSVVDATLAEAVRLELVVLPDDDSVAR